MHGAADRVARARIKLGTAIAKTTAAIAARTMRNDLDIQSMMHGHCRQVRLKLRHNHLVETGIQEHGAGFW